MKYRHELKYLIHKRDYSLVRLKMFDLLQIDEHAESDGTYTVTSLYFDDYFNSAYHEKYAGIPARQKYRIRAYNHSDKVIHLERKLKRDSFVSKDSTPLDRQGVERILLGDYDWLLDRSENLMHLFYYEAKAHLLRPRVVVEYEREAYVVDAGTVRICFDQNIRAGMQGFDPLDADMPMLEALPPDMLVMEVKYTEFLPAVFSRILPQEAADYTAVSKFILCCEKTMHKRSSTF